MHHVTSLGAFLLAASALYHWPMGILCILSVRTTRRVAGALYSLKLPDQLDPRYEFVWKPLGAYALFTAAVATDAFLHRDSGYAARVLALLAGMYLLRALLRWVYRDLFERAFGVGLRRNLVNIAFNTLLAGVILLFGVA